MTRAAKIAYHFDRIAVHKVWGYAVFFLILFLVFEGTFVIGAYPVDWISQGVAALSSWLGEIMSPGALKSLIIDGVVAGVGGVILFVPNILLLFLFLSILEQSGYMKRATRLMDSTMHKVGLSGESFLILVMGFGCNVPAILAAKGISNRHIRIVTMLINPFMSCSARLPIYILFAGTFFPHSAGLVFFAIYLLGFLVAAGVALFISHFITKRKYKPAIKPLPKYSMPAAREIYDSVWEQVRQYISKIGGVILVASIAVWFLGYYPRNNMPVGEMSDNSYISRIGDVLEPVMAPIGLNGKMSTALLCGMTGKELIVSTLGVLYATDSEGEQLSEKLISAETVDGKRDFSGAVALSFMVFSLLYFPCIPTLAAIYQASTKAKLMVMSAVYSTLIAWVLAFITYHLALLIL